MRRTFFLALSALAFVGLGCPASGQELPRLAPETMQTIPPLAKAVLSRNLDRVRELIEARANIDEPVRAREGARAGFTPLILASALSDVEMAGLLVERGAKITILDDFHRSALWYAALNESFPLLSVLARAPGAAEVVDAPDSRMKRTPLHIAVSGNDPESVQLLVARLKASVQVKDIFGETPVEFCEQRQTEACKGLPR